MDTIIKEWKKLLDEFKDSVDKDATAIRECKAALQEIRPDYVENHTKGRYIRSEDPIIISSPNIIIGNVDAEGNLLGDAPGRVLLRGRNISLEGVGDSAGEEYGSVVTRATSIRQIAVDPGIDGLEEVVMEGSEILNQARCVSIDSTRDNDMFISRPASLAGVNIVSDSQITIDSSFHLSSKRKRIDKLSASIEKSIKKAQGKVGKLEGAIDQIFETLNESMTEADTLKLGDKEISSKVGLLNDLRQKCEDATKALSKDLGNYVRAISQLAEAKRKKALLQAVKEKLPTDDDFRENGSNTSLMINSDVVLLSTLNGNGEPCVSDTAGIMISSKQVDITSRTRKNELIDGSSFRVCSMTIDFNATAPKYDDDKWTKGKVQPVGSVNVYAKEVNVKSVDSQFDTGAAKAEDKYKETALTEGSGLKVRMASVDVSTVGTDGVAAGSINLNSGTVGIVSVDLDKDGKVSKLNDKGQIVLGANVVTAGYQDDKLKTSKVQVLSGDTVVESKTAISLSQDGKSNVVINGSGVSVSSGANLLVGETTVSGKAAVKSLEASDAKIGNLEVTGEFKAKGINAGLAAPPADSSKKAPDPVKSEKPADVNPSQSAVLPMVEARDGNGDPVYLKEKK